MAGQESALSLACSLTVLCLVTVTLTVLNVCQTFILGNLFSPMIWLKSVVCALPLALSIKLFVPMLSATSKPSRTRLSMLATVFSHPIQGITFGVAGMLLHYLLPILNPILDVNIEEFSTKLYLISSGLFSGLFFFCNLAMSDTHTLKYSRFRIRWPTRLRLALKPVLEESLKSAGLGFRTFLPIWICSTYISSSLSFWSILSPVLHCKIFLMFFSSQSLLQICLCLTRLMATDPRLYHIDSPLANEVSLINLLRSKDDLERHSALQDLAIMSRYSDPRRAQIYELSIPGGKPKIWNAIWSAGYSTLSDFNTKLEKLTKPKSGEKTPVKPKPIEKFSTPMTNTPVANINSTGKAGHRFLWSKQSSSSPPRNCSVTETQTVSTSSVFQKMPDGKSPSFSFHSFVEAQKISLAKKFRNIADYISNKVLSLRPIGFWIEVRPEYATLSLLSEMNSVRLSMISLSNIIAAAPNEDKYGVTQAALEKFLRILNKINKGLDRLCRNNQQRSELRKLRNESRSALGKIYAAYGSSLDELKLDK